ncbi:hypothetical protein M9Y10_040749 [Tritrichomonas musculus]|uniref:RING-type domain-containing protein n=1 Tax=Tritrichomonas musculus TaxID=1915356 RepID=A0ABR2K3D5_9EUKA
MSDTKSIVFVENGHEDDDTLCIRCRNKKRNCFLLDCGHKVFCQKCDEAAFKNKEKCPLCRFQIMKVSS